MSFQGYLTPAQIQTVVQDAISSDLIMVGRALYLQGIFKPYALALPTTAANLLDQFNLDVVSLNGTERLANGEVPLCQFLRNAANLLRLRGRPEAETFETLANLIGNNVSGIPTLPEPATLPEIIKNEAIVGVDDMVDFPFLAGGVRVGSSVARIVVPRFENGVLVMTNTGAPWTMTGTAWVIAPTLALTNRHVIKARVTGENDPSQNDFDLQGSSAEVEFDFDMQNSAITKIPVTGVEASSEPLDYAIVRLQAQCGRPALPFNPQKVTFGPATYLPVNIIQHPRGLAKRVAFRNNLVSGADANTIRYFTDTDFGSSGSPVCDDNWRVLALHRGAQFVKGVNFQGKQTAYVNFGSQIQAILDTLKISNPALHDEIKQAQV